MNKCAEISGTHAYKSAKHRSCENMPKIVQCLALQYIVLFLLGEEFKKTSIASRINYFSSYSTVYCSPIDGHKHTIFIVILSYSTMNEKVISGFIHPSF